ncbi:transcription factor 19 isoform X2 [Vulpes vulpes]|uniref:Transcription factor 19 isoform X2 n=1 Tax=Vulpes vulpes TaxID=9627 RepID=A0ABM4XZS1_VULVU
MLPCFQLLRIGGGRGGDLYTFHPPNGAGCTYRLGCRADLCDVALQPQREPGLISGVHAELHAERRGDDWRVSLEDHSSQGTLVNNVRLPRGHRLELSDGDLVTFGPEGPPGTSPSEFYFMFQQVRVKPQDFAAITIPREVGSTPSDPPPRNRRKSAHRVLAELDDEGEIPEAPPVFMEPRKKLRVETTPQTPAGNRRGCPWKHPVSTPRAPPAAGGGEPCAATCCYLPQEETVAWVQCDGCNVWFHVACVGFSIQAAREADFRCPGCHVGIQT